MNNLLDALMHVIAMTQQNLPIILKMLLALWVFNIINWVLLKGRLNVLGIYPRTLHGLFGIFFSPFLHGNFNHLFFNTIPLFLLLDFMLIGGLQQFYAVSLIIIVLSGLAVWLFGRRAIHIGASGLIMGYWGFLLTNAYQHPTANTIVLALVTLYYLGGLVLNLFPSDVKVSFEGHLFGVLAGVASAFLYPSMLQYHSFLPF